MYCTKASALSLFYCTYHEFVAVQHKCGESVIELSVSGMYWSLYIRRILEQTVIRMVGDIAIDEHVYRGMARIIEAADETLQESVIQMQTLGKT